MTWTLPASAWTTVVAMLELTAEPWPESLASHDLDYLRAEVAAGRRGRFPGRPFLAGRWSWTAHGVRRFLETRPAPAQTPAKTDPIHVKPADPVITEPDVTSGTPAQRQNLGRPAGRGEGSPAQRQPATSSETGGPALSVDSHQLAASSPPDARGLFPPHTPPSISLSSTSTSKDRSEGVQGEPPAESLIPAGLQAQANAVPEAGVFLRVWTRWRNHPKAPQRWTGGPSDALGWFLELLASQPDTKMGKILGSLDVSAALESWDAWLSDRADGHGRAGTKSRSKFPRGWKNALRTWFTNQVKYGRNLTPAAERAKRAGTRRRGAWAGRSTDYTAKAPTTPTQTAPCTLPGDPDALHDF